MQLIVKYNMKIYLYYIRKDNVLSQQVFFSTAYVKFSIAGKV